MSAEFKFGEVHLISFLYVSDPKLLKQNGTNSYVTKPKTKLVLVLSNNKVSNEYNAIQCILITSKVRHGEHVPKGVAGLNMESYIQTREIYTIDKTHFQKKIWDLPQEYLTKVYLDLLFTLNFENMREYIFQDPFNSENNLL